MGFEPTHGDRIGLAVEIPTGMGFEPTHGDRIGLAVQRLNHSATLSQCSAVRGLRDLSCNVSFGWSSNPPRRSYWISSSTP